MKALFALVIVLSSFAAPAQASENWIARYYLDDVDCFGETAQQGSQIIEMDLFCAALLNDADGDAITGPDGAEVIPVGAIQPGDENSTVDYSGGSDDELALDATTEQGAMSTRIITIKPTIDHGEAKINVTDDVAITGPNYSEDVEVGAIQTSDGNPIAAHSSQSDDRQWITQSSRP